MADRVQEVIDVDEDGSDIEIRGIALNRTKADEYVSADFALRPN